MSQYEFRQARAGDEPAIQALVFSVLREYGLKHDPDTDSDLRDIVGSYAARGGTFQVLVSAAGEIVGCGGCYPLTGGDAEIRKMYLRRDARGQGHGRALLRDLIKFAKENGFKRVVLETASVLKEAIALYRDHGFIPVRREPSARCCDQAYILSLIQTAD